MSTLVIALTLTFITRFAERPFSGSGLYFYSMVTDFLLPAYLGFALYLLLTPSPTSLSPDESFVSLLSFLAGHFVVQGVVDLFDPGYVGSYELFVAPSMRIVVMLVVSVAYYRFCAETFWTRYLYLVMLAAVPFLAGVPQFLFAVNILAGAIPATIGTFLGAFAMVLFWTGGRSSIQFR